MSISEMDTIGDTQSPLDYEVTPPSLGQSTPQDYVDNDSNSSCDEDTSIEGHPDMVRVKHSILFPVNLPDKSASFDRSKELLVSNKEHRCLGCSMKFLQESDLEYHLTVRSLVIRVFCLSCQDTLYFANRCQFAVHFHSHGTHPELVDLRHVKISVAPHCDLICPVCDKPVKSREGHFNNDNKISQGKALTCPSCELICPTKCFLVAHQRTHSTVSLPFTIMSGRGQVCPECIQVFPYLTKTEFETHLEVECFHRSRAVLWRCITCPSVYTLDKLCDHILAKHSNMFYKCDLCPTAFKSMFPVLTHFKQVHTESKPRYKLIRHCPICNTLYKSSDSAKEHVKTHLLEKQQYKTYAFVCSKCQTSFPTPQKLREHFLVHKQ